MKFFPSKRDGLLYPFWIMTISAILLAVLSQFLINDSLRDIKKEGKLIDTANDQGTRSLKLVKEIAADKLEGKTVGLPLDILIDSLSLIQHTTLTAKGQSASPFINQYRNLDRAFTEFYAVLEVASTGTDNYSFVSLMNAQEIYLSQLDKLIVAIDSYSSAKIHRFRVLQLLIMLGSVTVIILEALFIFLPAIKKIKQQNNQLRKIAFNQSHMVRRPLANIKGLLHLTDIVSTVEEKEELLVMIKQEADHLDIIIRNTVSQAALT